MLVVEGSFTNEYKKQQVRLSVSADYFYNNATPGVSEANVTISDGSTVYELVENPAGSGIYETIDSIAGEPGKTYTLDIHLKEVINNTTHYHASGEMLQGIEIDSLVAIIFENPVYMEGFDMDSMLIYTIAIGQDPSEINNYYQLNLYDNGVLINDSIDEVYVTDDKEGINGEYMHPFFFFQQFDEGDTVQLEIISVEREYFDFVNTTQQLADLSFDPFDMSGPPANSTGNIKGAEAIGFFKVAFVSIGTAIAQPDEEGE
jgi:hypothetical protein